MSDLTAEESKNARAAMRYLRARCGGWQPLAKMLRVSLSTVHEKRGGVSARVVFRIAKLAGVGVDDVLTGRFPEPGTCPHCGHRPIEVVER